MLGENILKLRKSKGLSQEQLGEQVAVTRQTISNWELGETSPNPEQLKLLSKALDISIDELLENDVSSVLIQKVSNTEKLAGIVINILKVIGILIIISLFFTIVSIMTFTVFRQSVSMTHEKTVFGIEEYVGDKTYNIEIGTDGTFNCYDMPMEMKMEILDIINFENLEESERNIQKYFIELREKEKME